jgi:hypothetical protein
MAKVATPPPSWTTKPPAPPPPPPRGQSGEVRPGNKNMSLIEHIERLEDLIMELNERVYSLEDKVGGK